MNLPFGTLHLVLSGERMIVCSDSRGHSEVGPVTDDLKKLFQAGRRTACGIGGVMMLGPDEYVSTRIEALCSTDEFTDAPRKFLTALGDMMSKPLSELFELRPLPELETIFSAFTVKKAASGEVDLLELQFPIEFDAARGSVIAAPRIKRHLENQVPPGYFFLPFGRPDCVPSDIHRLVNPDLADDVVIKCIDDAFERAQSSASCRDEIGGPIDIATIESGGFRWLRRKAIRL